MTEIDKLIEDEKRLAIRDRESYCHYLGDPTYAYREGYESGMDKGIEIVLSKWQEAERWRKVSEKLPDPDIAVLCRMKSPNVIVEGFIYKHNGISKIETQPDFEFEDYANGEVVEWKPIS